MILNDFMSVHLCFSRKSFDYIAISAIIKQWWKLSFFWKKINNLFIFQNFYGNMSSIKATQHSFESVYFRNWLRLKKKNRLPSTDKAYIWWKTLFIKNKISTKLIKINNKIVNNHKKIHSQQLKFLYVTTEDTLVEYVRNYAISQKMYYSAGKWMPGLLSNFSKRRWFFESNLFSLENTNILMPQMPSFVFLFNFNPKLSFSKEIFASYLPIFAICDTNADPRITFSCPGNDNSLSSVYFYSKLFNKVLSS